MKLIDDIPWWAWSIIWVAFGLLLLVGSAVVESTALQDFSVVLLLPGMSAVFVGFLVPSVSIFKDELEPVHQVILWIGISVAIVAFPYLVNEVLP